MIATMRKAHTYCTAAADVGQQCGDTGGLYFSQQRWDVAQRSDTGAFHKLRTMVVVVDPRKAVRKAAHKAVNAVPLKEACAVPRKAEWSGSRKAALVVAR